MTASQTYSLTTTSSTAATGIASFPKAQTDTLTQCAISGTYGTVTFVFEGTIDGTNWFPVAANLMSTWAPANGTIAPSDNAESLYNIPNTAGLSAVRLAVSAIASGTLVVTFQSGSFVGLPSPPSANLASYGNVSSTGAILSSSPTGGVGYASGAGAAVTQGTSRTTTVVCTGMSGAITLFSAAGSATPFSFTVTNTSVAIGDVIHLSQRSGTDVYTTQQVTAVANGSFRITLANASGTTTEQPVFNFAVIKAVSA